MLNIPPAAGPAEITPLEGPADDVGGFEKVQEGGVSPQHSPH